MPLIGLGRTASQGIIALYFVGSEPKVSVISTCRPGKPLWQKKGERGCTLRGTKRRHRTRRGSAEGIGKPDSVPPANVRGQRPFLLSRRCRRDRATLPEDSAGKDNPVPRRLAPPKGESSYSVLLRMGFARAVVHTAAERALTSPFHPCRRRPRADDGGLFSVALSPDHSGPPLAAIPSLGVRTFLSSFPKSGRSIPSAELYV